ncbi:hypothetical protein FHW83_005365 [Duganella sp. SG902]|uniref:DUF4276 family protein n=1 Tax=Duganella sp. SG902 TaxID=2587016 RepID=UPI00159D8220|nr:DUF4276 family protein [Duganella sp. SG902]NVM79524.1 hypothetical protein [Duganella sp. SG902]
MNVIAIVEGDGEVKALPTLLRRFPEWRGCAWADLPQPIRVRRDRFLNNDDEFRKQVTLAGYKCGEAGWILILLDADDDCPVTMADSILRRAQTIVPGHRISVVIATREYEAWFIAAASSLDGQRGFSLPAHVPDAESVRAAKEWISSCMPHGHKYHEVHDQAAFSSQVNLDLAYANSRSFRKLVSEWDKQMAVAG